MANTRTFLLVFIGLLSCCWLNAQVSFTTTVSANRIAKNEILEVTYEIKNGSPDNFINPSFPDWQVVGGPNVSSSTFITNGSRSSSEEYQFLLRPIKPGSFKIAGATVVIDGKTYTSNAVSVTVTNSTVANPQPPASSIPDPFQMLVPDPIPQQNPRQESDAYFLRDDEDIREKTKKNLFLEVQVSKKTCYPGEAIRAVYKLYSRVNMDASMAKRPSFTGFSSVEMPDKTHREYDFEERDGKQFKVYTIRSVQLYPLLPGTQYLQPAEIEARVQYHKISSSFGYDPYSPGNKVDFPYLVTCDSVPVQVLPFPEADKPADFKGVTGNFNIAANVPSAKLDRNEAGTIQVEISGSGNWAMVQRPDIAWPAGIDVYEPKISESLDSEAVPIAGKRLYEYPFSTNQAGQIQIPPVSFSFFDPETKQYKTITTSIPLITVSQQAKENEIPPQDPYRGLSGADNTQVFTEIVRIAFPVLAVVLVLWLLIKNWRKPLQVKTVTETVAERRAPVIEPAPVQKERIQNPETPTRFMPSFPAHSEQEESPDEVISFPEELYNEEPMEPSPEEVEDAKPYFTRLRKQLLDLLWLHFHISSTDANSIRTQLRSKNVSSENIDRIVYLLHQSDRHIYSPFHQPYSKSDMEALLAKVIESLPKKG